MSAQMSLPREHNARIPRDRINTKYDQQRAKAKRAKVKTLRTHRIGR